METKQQNGDYIVIRYQRENIHVDYKVAHDIFAPHLKIDIENNLKNHKSISVEFVVLCIFQKQVEDGFE